MKTKLKQLMIHKLFLEGLQILTNSFKHSQNIVKKIHNITMPNFTLEAILSQPQTGMYVKQKQRENRLYNSFSLSTKMFMMQRSQIWTRLLFSQLPFVFPNRRQLQNK